MADVRQDDFVAGYTSTIASIAVREIPSAALPGLRRCAPADRAARIVASRHVQAIRRESSIILTCFVGGERSEHRAGRHAPGVQPGSSISRVKFVGHRKAIGMSIREPSEMCGVDEIRRARPSLAKVATSALPHGTLRVRQRGRGKLSSIAMANAGKVERISAGFKKRVRSQSRRRKIRPY